MEVLDLSSLQMHVVFDLWTLSYIIHSNFYFKLKLQIVQNIK